MRYLFPSPCSKFHEQNSLMMEKKKASCRRLRCLICLIFTFNSASTQRQTIPFSSDDSYFLGCVVEQQTEKRGGGEGVLKTYSSISSGRAGHPVDGLIYPQQIFGRQIYLFCQLGTMN
ncbi:hypothetical protein CEXT_563551 [Caerostris extrusa]|uniref:Uncharacterized protein n=1 Tax=Caerostris extrusa TaxID=172846 RepID=A0AAV4Y2K1_CAEEX|nr:hypothetical protein CEXT_563551 [Caerostris extrusa]